MGPGGVQTKRSLFGQLCSVLQIYLRSFLFLDIKNVFFHVVERYGFISKMIRNVGATRRANVRQFG